MKTILTLLISFYSFSNWTLLSSQALKFNSNKVKVYIASTSCDNAGFDTNTLKEYTEEAVDGYWNKVATSAIELKVEGVVATSVDGDTSPGMSALKTGNNSILIGCNDDASAFSSTTTAGVATITCAGIECQGGVLLNATTESPLANNSKSETMAVIAHEIGHALGLGHSKEEVSLMYYQAGTKIQESLSQDDMNGITWLYPNEKEFGGLGGSCATIDSTDGGGGPGSGLVLLSLLIMISAIQFKTSKLRLPRTI